MRVTILTVGSRGDVQPFLALAAGVRAAGHEVTVATHGQWAEQVHSAGLSFARVEGAPHLFMDTEEGQAWMSSGARPLEFLRRVLPFMRRQLREQLDDSVRACAGAEALVFTPLALAGYHLAEALGIPCCGASLQPVSPTRAFPSPVLPPGLSFGPLNRASHHLVDRGYAEVWRGEVNAWRASSLHMPPLPHLFSYSHLRGSALPLLYGFSSSVIPRPPDWPGSLHITGYWFRGAPAGWAPPDELIRFLEAGPPPVYVGFGSMILRNPQDMAGLVCKALRDAGLRGILSGILAAAVGPRQGEGIFSIASVPHDWLLPRVAAAVHHGGAGTTAACLRAGIPALVVPLVADQFFWGERIRALGAGPAPIPYTRLTIERLAPAIAQCVGSAGMRERAAGIGRALGAEDGVARAAEVLECVLHPRGSANTTP